MKKIEKNHYTNSSRK